MIYLELFLTFFKIGLFTFGGGYAMIPLVESEVVNNGWLTSEQILNFIAVSESTPGPIAINMATFVGSSQGGIPGAALATLGVVLPSFIIILVIALAMKAWAKNRYVSGVMAGINPIVVGLILATGAATLLMAVVSGISDVFSDAGAKAISVSPRALVTAALVAAFYALMKFVLKKKASPVMVILFSALCGIVVYGI